VSKVLKFLGDTVLKIMGWKIEGRLPNLPKYVAIIGVHTSNWDFFICLMARLSLRMPSHWFGKHTIFFWPFGSFFKALGGIPIYRHLKQNVVEQGISEFKNRQAFIVTLAPEGTRNFTEGWKTGFYYMAKGAKVPILPIGLDYKRKILTLFDPFQPTDSIETDITSLKNKFIGLEAKYPQNDSINFKNQ